MENNKSAKFIQPTELKVSVPFKNYNCIASITIYKGDD
jgi:hypothetical protein